MKLNSVMLVIWLVVCSPCWTCHSAETVVRVSSRRELAQALAEAQPGTKILVSPGKYAGGLSRSGLQGTAEQPIVIAAAEPQRPPVIEAGSTGLHLSQPQHVELRGLEFVGATGNGLNIDDGGAGQSTAHHIKLVQLTLRDVGPRGNHDGIKLSGVDDFELDGCTIERWGSSGSAVDMVGCHRGVVRGCTFRHPGADSANGVQTKGGSSEITIRRCRFEQAGGRSVNVGGSTGLAYFRPAPQGFEARNITVEDCYFVGSMAPIAFVGVDGAIVRYNTFYRPSRWGVRILQENQAPDFVPCRHGKFEHNIVAFRANEVSTMVNVGPATAPETFVFSDNVWYCIDNPTSTQSRVRLPVTEINAQYGIDPQFVNAEQGNLRAQRNLEAGVRHSAQKAECD